MNHLKQLEAEAIHIFRIAHASFKNPYILFSGGKDSTVLVHLARKAFYPLDIPFKLLHVDTGHNFTEALTFRDNLVIQHNLNLTVKFVEDTIKQRNLSIGQFESRNALQSYTLIDAIHELDIDACIGGARRDEEKARAKERIFSRRNYDGKWMPHEQDPELWDIYNVSLPKSSSENTQGNMRIFPISNWTELDVWEYIKLENISLPSIYFSHQRECFLLDNKLLAFSPYISIPQGAQTFKANVRYRTVGDMSCTAAIESNANDIDSVIDEIRSSRISERGETRIDDTISDAAMEDRKSLGYF